MSVLIIYATVEGQTGKIARFAADTVRKQGQEVTLLNLADDPATVPLDEADHIILAGSVHERRHPKAFEVFLSANREALAEKHTLLMSVSLSAAFPEGQDEAADYVGEMKMRTGFEPSDEMLVPGAVRTAHYDYYARQIVRFVVLRGRGFDPSVEEWEFTDWNAVEERVTEFV